jgi:hypothetical protein
MAQVVECLSSECEALSSNHCTTKINKYINKIYLHLKSIVVFIAILKSIQAERWWLMPTTLATQKAEIRRIMV